MSMQASECKCVVCGKPAVAFWPLIDPDIPAEPYCRKCLGQAKIKVLMDCFGKSEKEATLFVNNQNQSKE